MRSLFISTERPEPGYGAGERSLSICNALSRLGEVETMVVVYPGGPGHAERPGEHVVRLLDHERDATRWYWRRRKYSLADYRRDGRVARFVAELHRKRPFDLFFGRYQLPLLAACARLGPTLVDLDDVPVNVAATKPAAFGAVQRAWLRRALAPLRGVFVTKQGDAALLSHPRVAVLPCISTQPERARALGPEGAARRLLFVGGLRWAPNRDGVSHFVDAVLPRIRAKFPDATLRLVGEGGDFARGRDGVDVAGFAKDLAAEYEAAAVVIVPVRSGAGSCVKLAEAAGFGRPIVATPFAARGYEGILAPGRDLLVAPGDDEFASGCIELLGDAPRRAALAGSAKRTAAEQLSQGAIDRIVRTAAEKLS
jgi:glycosyltransferase involved in cell wall biosynthesis